ncbi:MAG TPA: DNA-3-methyladenine glycosylase [Anaerolineae bacterium]
MTAPLPRSFYARDTRIVARDLLGAHLVRVLPDGTRLSGIIVETEAYRPADQASHAHRGRTERNAAMFLAPGTAYVYFTYGMYYCLNIVTEEEGIPAAVLIRALEPLEGIAVMQKFRDMRPNHNRPIPPHDLCRGPARLCMALAIDGQLNAYDMFQRESVLFVERGATLLDSQVGTSARIGVFGDDTALAAEWRWFVAENAFVSHTSRSHRSDSKRTKPTS